MIREHDTVVLVTAVPAEGLLPGDVGTVVHVYRDGQAYEIEFITLEGKTARFYSERALEAESCNSSPQNSAGKRLPESGDCAQ